MTLVSSDVNEEESVAIGDFGVSRPLKHAMELVTTMVGTPCYLSPEVCKGKPYSYKSDIWSLGCVLFEMIVLRPPFGSAPNLEALITRIVRADFVVPDCVAAECPEALRCVRGMLRLAPERRPTAQALVSRPKTTTRSAQLLESAPSGRGGASSPSRPPGGASSPGRPPPPASGQNGAVDPPARVGSGRGPLAPGTALSPRCQGRARLARSILEAEAEQDNVLQALSEYDYARQVLPARQAARSPGASSSRNAAAAGSLAGEGGRRRGMSQGLAPNAGIVTSAAPASPVVASRVPSVPPERGGPVRRHSTGCVVYGSGGNGGAMSPRQNAGVLNSSGEFAGDSVSRSPRAHPVAVNVNVSPGVSGARVAVKVSTVYPRSPSLEAFDFGDCDDDENRREDPARGAAAFHEWLHDQRAAQDQPASGNQKTACIGGGIAVPGRRTDIIMASDVAKEDDPRIRREASGARTKETPPPGKRSITIGDRIEGIRACLEAKLGTQRFQKLYESLAARTGDLANVDAKARSKAGDRDDGVPEGLLSAVDLNREFAAADVALVAKLVACENSYFS